MKSLIIFLWGLGTNRGMALAVHSGSDPGSALQPFLHPLFQSDGPHLYPQLPAATLALLAAAILDPVSSDQLSLPSQAVIPTCNFHSFLNSHLWIILRITLLIPTLLAS